METNNQDKALAMELARILKPTAFELIKAIGEIKCLLQFNLTAESPQR
jgi:hypothetical protein